MDINLEIFKEMWVGVSIFLLFVFFLNKMSVFRKALVTKNPTWRHTLFFISIFTFIGLCGLYWNVPVNGGLINFRSVGPIVGGYIGGPFVGMITGILVGGCRILLYQTSANEVHGLMTVLQGITAGLLSSWIKNRSHMWFFSFLYTLIIEFCSAFFLLLIFQPSGIERKDILLTVFPIVVTNSVAVALFIGVLEDSLQLTQRISFFTAQMMFRSVNIVIRSVHSELNKENLSQISDIIMRSLPELAAVSLTSGTASFLLKTPSLEGKDFIEKALKEARSGSDNLHSKGIWISRVDYHGDLTSEMIAVNMPGSPLTHFEIEFLSGMQKLIETISLFTHLKKEEELLKESEIRMLQAQINPHFLFNTLNTINYYCMADPETAINLIGYLSDYYRYSLTNPTSLVSVSEELQDIKAYVQLERARFEDRLRVIYHIPKELPLKIPPLLLQPLVENAIEHGICTLPKGGIIWIGIKECPKSFKFYVADNGVGIKKEVRRTLLKETGERNCIGLINVHKRLIAMYGNTRGLSLHSREGKGTIVSFHIAKP